MNDPLIVAIPLFGIMFALIVAGLPIAVAIGASALLTLVIFDIAPLHLVPQMMMTIIDSWVMLAIPFFILSGTIIAESSIGRRLVDLFNAVFGKLPGGLAVSSVFTSMVFGGLTGSAAAEAAALTSIMARPMEQYGYPRRFSVSLIGSAATTAALVPPSITFILYGVLARESISDMFVAGVLPGVLISLMLAGGAVIIARSRGYGRSATVGRMPVLLALKRAGWALMAPVLILGGIRIGVFTPTESAIFITLYALFVAMYVHRDIGWRDLPGIIRRAAVVFTAVMFIVATASVFAWIVNTQGIAAAAASLISSVGDDPTVLILAMLAILVVVGMFLDATSTLFIMLPIMLPVATGIGMDLVQFGIFLTMALNLALVTPPVGICLFVTAKVGRVPVLAVAASSLPWILIMLAAILLVAFIPAISLVFV